MVVPRALRVKPGEVKVLTVEFDSSTEPDFYGSLSIEVTGYAGAADQDRWGELLMCLFGYGRLACRCVAK